MIYIDFENKKIVGVCKAKDFNKELLEVFGK